MTEEQEDRALEEQKSLLANSETKEEWVKRMMSKFTAPNRCPECTRILSADQMGVLRCYNEDCGLHGLTAMVEQPMDHEHLYTIRVPKNERTDGLRFVCALYRCECGDEKMM